MLTSQLNLSNNQLCGLDQYGRGTYTTEGITAIADALKVTASVTSVTPHRITAGVKAEQRPAARKAGWGSTNPLTRVLAPF